MSPKLPRKFDWEADGKQARKFVDFVPETRRLQPPWAAEVTPNCFIVRDANSQALSYIHYESEPGRRSAAKFLSKDEALLLTSPRCPDFLKASP